jgi:hypothetical protein
MAATLLLTWNPDQEKRAGTRDPHNNSSKLCSRKYASITSDLAYVNGGHWEAGKNRYPGDIARTLAIVNGHLTKLDACRVYPRCLLTASSSEAVLSKG